MDIQKFMDEMEPGMTFHDWLYENDPHFRYLDYDKVTGYMTGCSCECEECECECCKYYREFNPVD